MTQIIVLTPRRIDFLFLIYYSKRIIILPKSSSPFLFSPIPSHERRKGQRITISRRRSRRRHELLSVGVCWKMYRINSAHEWRRKWKLLVGTSFLPGLKKSSSPKNKGTPRDDHIKILYLPNTLIIHSIK